MAACLPDISESLMFTPTPIAAKVKYSVDGTEYSKLVWINAGHPVPKVGDTVHVRYRSDKPKKAKVL